MTLTIRPYQSDAIEFLVKNERACLYDEMGLGKCMQALLSMRDLEPTGKLLIVATGDAIGVWQDETVKWLDEEASVFVGLKPDPAALDRPDGIVITNYSRLATVLLEDARWDGVIFDESQALRNRNTRTLFATVRKAYDRRSYGLQGVPTFFLSGTPVVKAAGDLWPALHLIDKREWSSYWKFVHKYANTWHDHWGWHVEGVTNARKMWADLSPYVMRRTVDEEQQYLPPKVRQRVRLTMTPRQARAYNELESDMIAELDGGSGLLLTPSVISRETRLRQLLTCPRLLGIDDDGATLVALREIAANGARPFVVFSPFPRAFEYFQPAMEKVGRPTYIVRGGMGERLRESVDLFKRAARAGEAPVLLVSLAMAKSWSVSEYTNECYMAQFDWNNTTMEQAERRLARDGQTKTVFSKYFVHENTHDLDALSVLSGKRRLASVILDRARRHHEGR